MILARTPEAESATADLHSGNGSRDNSGEWSATQSHQLCNRESHLILLQMLIGFFALWSLPVKCVLGQSPDSLSPPKPETSVGWGMGTHGIPSHVMWSGFHIGSSLPKTQLRIGYSWLLLAPGGVRPRIFGRLKRTTETKRRLAERLISRHMGLDVAILHRMYSVSHDDKEALLYSYDGDKPHFSASETVFGPDPF